MSMTILDRAGMRAALVSYLLVAGAVFVQAQVPHAWHDSLVFHTFSIVAIDPRTGESGVAVTTRVPCVGNGVPWVRAGIGAVATQANTRTEYGNELLDALARGVAPDVALRDALARDTLARTRQIGVIAMSGAGAQHTGTGANPWAGQRAGLNYVTQGNLLVGPEVLEAVGKAFEASEGSARHLADRLIEAIAAGHALGGDARHGRQQSAAVVVADPRPERSRRSDGITASISVCENADPVAEMRRIYDSISQTLGYRILQAFAGNDIWQLKVMLHALGLYHPQEGPLVRGDDALAYTPETIAAVDAFRTSEKLAGPPAGSPSGLVDAETVSRLWAALERAGKARTVREALLETTAVRR
jgi:uncharacterized Ntn-hydrolase superfamily protein